MSVFVRVTPSRLMLDGDDLYRVAVTLDSAARSAQSALSGTGGMAGNEEAAQEFIDAYGDGAVNTLNAAGSYAQALRGLDTLLCDTANAYTDAGTVGTLEPVATRSPSSTPGSASTFSVPSAKAPGPEGPLGEFGEFVMDALAQIGVVLPDADTGKLGDAASAWSAFGTSISNAATALDGTLTNLASMDIPQAGDIRESRSLIAEKLREIAKAADGPDSLGSLCSKQKEQVEAMWEEIGWFLGQMAAEIALDLGLGALLSIATGGLGAPAVVAKIATTVMRWVLKIAALVKKLVTLTRMNALAAKILLKALAEGTQSAIATVTVQAAVNQIRGPEHAQSLLAVGLGSFAGGGIGGRVGDGGSHVLRISSRSGMSRVVLNTAVGAGEGAVDGLTDGLVQSGVTGAPFNPLSSGVMGALIGGAARPIGGGTRPNAPSTGGGGASSPSAPGVDVPSGGSPDAPSGPSGADAPSAPSVDGPAAPQGGGAPAGSSPAAGGGASTDTPDAPVVDGAGDASTPVDSSTTVDIPAGDAPDGTGVDVTSAADGPSVPDVSGPSADGGTPSIPDGGTPDTSTPSTPDTSTPATPDASTPAASTPSTPDTSVPSTPDASTPATPDASTPSTPDTSAPSTPDTSVPSTADTSTPSTPDTSTPSTPDAGTPSTPSSPDSTPSTPDQSEGDGSPAPAAAGAVGAAAGTATPSSPSTGTPDADASIDTSAFESAVAADAAAADASTDGGSSDGPAREADPATPGDTVDPNALDAADAAAAGAVAAGAAGIVGLHAGASGGRAPTTPASPTTPTGPSSPSTPGSAAPGAPGTPDGNAPDANSPDAADPATGGNTTSRTTPDIDAALAAINPNFDPFDPGNGYATNCGNTSAILNDFLNGNPSSEAPTGTLTPAQMEARTGNPQTPMTPDQIADSLREMGAGSHCVVGIDRSTGDGHWFNAYYDGTTVWSIDAQTGTRSPWPPNEPNATVWDASIRPEDVADPVAPHADADADADADPGADAGDRSSQTDGTSARDAARAGETARTGAGDSAAEGTSTPNSPSTDGMTSGELAEHFRPMTPTPEIRDMVQGEYERGIERPDPAQPDYRPTVFEADHIIPLREIVDLPGFRDLTHDQMLAIVNLEENFWGLGRRTNASKGSKLLPEWPGHPEFSAITPETRAMLRTISNDALDAVTDAIADFLDA